jgi:hypothetical protein
MHCNRGHKMKVKYDGLRAVAVNSLLAAILIAQAAFGADPVFVDAQVVEFESAAFTYKPSPFKVKQSTAEASAAIREFLAKHL